MSVVTHVKKSGNSYALHLPKSFVLAHDLDNDRRFRMDFHEGKIVIEPINMISEEEDEHNKMFAMLTQGMTPETMDKGLLKTSPVGQELL